LIKHAYDKVPYYHRLFDERGISPESIQNAGDLVRLSVLTKNLIRSNTQELLAKGVGKNQCVSLSTGGSTGEPLQFFRSKQDQLSWGYAAAQRSWGWAGYRMGDKLIRLNTLRKYRSSWHRINEILKRKLERVKFIDVKTLSADTLPDYVRQLEKYRPDYIWGYPSAVELLARFILKTGKPVFRFKAIITGAEQIYDYQRELFESVFDCKAFSNYSSWEAHAIAAECEEQNGYHITAENLIVEVVDSEGNPVPYGTEGKVLITNLHNYAMPFIRYSIGDLAIATDRHCPCGRGLPLLAALNGRIADLIYTKSGKCIPSIALPMSALAALDVKHFQYVQESYDKFIIRIVMNRDYPREHLENLSRTLISKYKTLLDEDMDISVEYTGSIPATESGKRKVCISNIIHKA
jgi:phenylacetate-CoA ligase